MSFVGTVVQDGVEYEINWPYRWPGSKRHDNCASIYRDGIECGGFQPPMGGPFKDAAEVLSMAEEFIREVGPDEYR